jgi:hypothetical protein
MRHWPFYCAAIFCGAVAIPVVLGTVQDKCRRILSTHKRLKPTPLTMPDLHLQSSMLCQEELLRRNRQADFKDEWLNLQLRWALETQLLVPASEMVLKTESDNLLVLRRGKEHKQPLLVISMHDCDVGSLSRASSSDANSFNETYDERRSRDISCWRDEMEAKSKQLENERKEQQAALREWLQQTDQFKRIARKLHPHADDASCEKLAMVASENWHMLHKANKIAHSNNAPSPGKSVEQKGCSKPPSTNSHGSFSHCSFESALAASPVTVYSTPPLSLPSSPHTSPVAHGGQRMEALSVQA